MANIFLTNSENITLRMHECGQDEYWFYHKGSYPNDNPLLYQKLINNATNEIIIWDPYFNIKSRNGDQDLFSNIKHNITIKILTYKGLDRNQQYLIDFQNAIKTIISPSKDARFGLRVINKSEPHTQGERFFHDRFLIIDNTDIYIIGSSIEYHLRFENALSTGIFKVSNIKRKNLLNQFLNTIGIIQQNIKFH